jgi:tetratricopeptide (TPR) repeat protein
MSALANTLELGNPNFEDTFAWILYKEKQFSKAKIWIEKAIKDDKSSASTFWDHYGDILFGNNEKERAIEAWTKALSLNPNSPSLKDKINKKHP